ncbi:hypothetical protein V494_00498 [Pseudogymnoascus sp. VKM F-4513 (FW-928)]|nr:hypothetical protein V494_00498 [Pseudogymnoascus sp. VKM F-4513 (FW-928)]
MAEMLSPAELGGWGRGAGDDGGLSDTKFSSCCPPAISPRTRIIAVCRVNDFRNASSPVHDGWFHSDFYLFRHLFSGLGANQLWLTCVDPVHLVTKYKEFVHGNPLGTRRVVLDESMIPSTKQPNNMRVLAPDILLERFLSSVEHECKEATRHDQNVLILIFGHGDSESFGVAIGGKTAVHAAPRLTIAKMDNAIRHTQHVAMIMTSCYSGGWIMKRSQDKSKAALNITIMAAAGHKQVSESWAKSESTGRAAGSIYASAIVQSAIQMQTADKEGVESKEEIESSTSYIGWAKFIYPTNNLELGMASLSIGQSRSTTLGQGFPGNFSNIVAEQARQYLNSFPGNDALGSNNQHSYFRLVAKGEISDPEHLEDLSDELRYRMSLMEVATRYKNFLELPIEDCHLFDTYAWEAWHNGGENEWHPYEEIRARILDASIFGLPVGNQGFLYTKPSEYLAIGFIKSGQSKAQMLAYTEKLTVFKKVVVSYIEERVLQTPEVQRRSKRFFRTFSRLGQQLRSLSPGKKKDKTPKKGRDENTEEESGSSRF